MTTKFQMVLPHDLAVSLRALATSEGISLAGLIRETMEARLRDANRREPARGLLSRMAGMGSAVPETNLSQNVDQYLYAQDPHA